MKNVALPGNIGAPATRALSAAGIKSLNDLSKFTGKEIAQIHGVGPSALGKLKTALQEAGLAFKQEKV